MDNVRKQVLPLSSERNDLIKQLKENGKIEKGLILFGAGDWGSYYLNTVKEFFMDIVFFDTNSSRWGQTFEGKLIIDFEDIKEKYKDYYITITSFNYYEDIFHFLKSQNMDHRIMMPVDGYINYNFFDYESSLKQDYEDYQKVYSLLSDDASKRIFIDRLNYFISGDMKFLVQMKSLDTQYFESEIIQISEQEVFVDAGAYSGDTVEDFIKQSKDGFKQIYSFEPEKSKQDIFQSKFEKYENIKLYPYGLWSQKDTLKFDYGNGESSRISDTAQEEVSVVAIDEILKDKVITYIKMDIEGAELEALHGAQNTIKEFKPKLAICVYHKPLDILQIPLFLQNLVPEYDFYLRHYNENMFETVIYAIPKKMKEEN